ncbi:putative Tic20 family protein [Rummeliibacillus stabekisii]|nr:putative Tic20 family protein [Rummeliibacillus stabekisii]
MSIQALLFQFVMWLLVTVGGILTFTIILAIIGIPMIIIFGIMGVIIPIIGIIRALQGTHWEYPIVGKWI